MSIGCCIRKVSFEFRIFKLHGRATFFALIVTSFTRGVLIYGDIIPARPSSIGISKQCEAEVDSNLPALGIPFNVSFQKDRIGSVDLVLLLPPSSLNLRKVGRHWKTSLIWVITQRNGDNKRFAEAWNGSITLTVGPEDIEHYLANGYLFRQRVAPNSVTEILHISVCDDQSGRVGSQAVSLVKKADAKPGVPVLK